MGRRGIPKGYKFKPESETVRNRVWTCFDDDLYAFLEDIVTENDVSFAKAVRMCVSIVSNLPLSEYQRAMRSVMWK